MNCIGRRMGLGRWVLAGVFGVAAGAPGAAGAVPLPTDATLAVPGQAGFAPRSGYDYVLAKTTPWICLVEDPTFEPKPKIDIQKPGAGEPHVSLFNSGSELVLLASASADAHIGYLVGSIDGSLNFRNRMSLTDRSAGIFVDNYYENRTRTVYNPMLTETALGWLKQDVKLFRKNCGTHFVQVVWDGATIRGAIAFRGSSVESEMKVGAQVKAGVLGSGGGVSGAFGTTVASEHVTLDLNYKYTGVTAGPTLGTGGLIPTDAPVDVQAINDLFTYSAALGAANLSGAGALQRVMIVSYEQAGNWDATKNLGSLGTESDATFSKLVADVQILEDAMARVAFALAHPRGFKNLWIAKDGVVNTTIDKQLKATLDKWEKARNEVLLPAIDACRSSWGTNCKAASLPSISAGDFPLPFDYECPADVTIQLGSGGAGGVVKGGSNLSLKSGNLTLDGATLGKATVQVQLDGAAAKVRFCADISETPSTTNSTRYEGCGDWNTATLKTPIPSSCQFVDNSKTVSFEASTKSSVSNIEPLLPKPGISVGACNIHTPDHSEPKGIGCVVNLTNDQTFRLVNKQDLLPVEQLTSYAQAAEAARKQKADESRKKVVSLLQQRHAAFRNKYLKATTAKAAPKL